MTVHGHIQRKMTQNLGLVPQHSELSLHLWHFVTQLLHFQPSFLLMAWESTGGTLTALGPCTHVADLKKALGSSSGH